MSKWWKIMKNLENKCEKYKFIHKTIYIFEFVRFLFIFNNLIKNKFIRSLTLKNCFKLLIKLF